MAHNRVIILIGLVLTAISVNGQTGSTEGLTVKKRMHMGEKIGLVPEGMPYHEWWNNNGILGIKLETVKGVLMARYLAKPGIDFMDFGGQDLGHDISIQKHPGFESLEDCRKFVDNALKGTYTGF